MTASEIFIPRATKRFTVAVLGSVAFLSFILLLIANASLSNYELPSHRFMVAEEKALKEYFPILRWQHEKGIVEEKLPVDPINPPSGYPWHRWNSATVNTDKFVKILERIGTRKDFLSGMKRARHFVMNDVIKTMDVNADGFSLLTLHARPMFVRNGTVYLPKDSDHYGNMWAWLLDDAIKMAKHLEPSNERMKKLASSDFPFVYDYFDYPFCGDDMVPVFRVNIIADGNECKFAWPFISSMHYYSSRREKKFLKTNPDEWGEDFARYDRTYPWESKIKKAVWRGSPTGFYQDTRDKPRFKLVTKAHGASETLNIFLDVKFTPDKRKNEIYVLGEKGHPAYKPIGESYIKPGMVEEQFMKYRAIIDIDGNAWSSRYGRIICYNSVVIKVESRYQAYFEKELKPWVHYIPVKGDLSDLEHNVKWAMSDENEESVRSMINKSSEYCEKKFLHHSLVSDFMWTLLDYVELLDNTPGFHETWKKNEVAFDLPAQEMTPLPSS